MVRLLTMLALALGGVGMMAASASAGHVQCGALVTQDVVLDGDLIDCPGDGLRIGADDITVDLSGHVLDGSGTGDGVRLQRRQRVTVANGTITGFATGVRLEFADENRFESLALRDNAGAGASLLVSSRNRLSGLAVTGNGAYGITVMTGSHENVSRQSSFDGNSSGGIRVTNAGGNLIAHNDLTGGDAIDLLGGTYQNVVSHNRVHAPRTDGILLFSLGNHENVLRSNRITDAGRDGIALWDDAARTTVYRNRITGSASDGIEVLDGSGTVVEENRTDGNLIGILVAEPQTTVTANRANHNVFWGIYAGLPVMDGGRNRAHGNGEGGLQCINVTCR